MSPAPPRRPPPPGPRPKRPAPPRPRAPRTLDTTLGTPALTTTTRPVQVPLWSTMPPSRHAKVAGVSRQRGAPEAIPPPGKKGPGTARAEVLSPAETSLLDLVDNLLNRGVLLTGDAVLGVADVDLIYLRLSALLAAADRVLGRKQAGGSPRRRWPRR